MNCLIGDSKKKNRGVKRLSATKVKGVAILLLTVTAKTQGAHGNALSRKPSSVTASSRFARDATGMLQIVFFAIAGGTILLLSFWNSTSPTLHVTGNGLRTAKVGWPRLLLAERVSHIDE